MADSSMPTEMPVEGRAGLVTRRKRRPLVRFRVVRHHVAVPGGELGPYRAEVQPIPDPGVGGPADGRLQSGNAEISLPALGWKVVGAHPEAHTVSGFGWLFAQH